MLQYRKKEHYQRCNRMVKVPDTGLMNGGSSPKTPKSVCCSDMKAFNRDQMDRDLTNQGDFFPKLPVAKGVRC